MTIQGESRPDIPKDQVRFVNDRIAYVFTGYDVTVDAGPAWSVWDAGRALPRSDLKSFGGLKQVSLAPGAKGKCNLKWQSNIKENGTCGRRTTDITGISNRRSKS